MLRILQNTILIKVKEHCLFFSVKNLATAEQHQAWRCVVCNWLLKWYSKYRGLVWYGIKYVQKIPYFNNMGMRSQIQKYKKSKLILIFQ